MGGTTMNDKQKKALKVLNELWYVSHNDGLSKLRDEDYYILVECILDRITYANKDTSVTTISDPCIRKEEQQ